MKPQFNIDMLSPSDQQIARKLIGYGPWRVRDPDLVIVPQKTPYLYRWHLYREEFGGTYLHVQVQSDPERPLHDHPSDNMSVILSGGYDEIISELDGPPTAESTRTIRRVAGETVFRKAEWPHRLLLPADYPYTMTLWSTGKRRRDWGFWFDDKWRSHTEVTKLQDGKSIHIGKGGM